MHRFSSLLSVFAVALMLTQSVSAQTPPADTDGDGIPDQQEDSNGNGAYDGGETDPYNADTDGGGESDGSEVAGSRNPVDANDDLTADPDGDGWVNGVEAQKKTSAANPDTDGDGVRDPEDPFPLEAKYQSDTNGNELPDEWEAQAGLSDGQAITDKAGDPDEDGLTNAEELANATSPLSADSDRDGVDDKTEITQGTDPNENACLNYARTDAYFADTAGHWAADRVRMLRGVRVLPDNTQMARGFGEGKSALFKPDQPVTRYEFLKLVMLGTCTKLWNSAVADKPVFSDVPSVPSETESEDATLRRRIIYSAVRYDIVRGYSDGTFRPDTDINRAEAVSILHKAARLDIFDPSAAALDPLVFTDVTPADWFTASLDIATRLSIVSGYSDGTFGPAKPITRAEAAKIVYETMLRNPMINGYVLSE